MDIENVRIRMNVSTWFFHPDARDVPSTPPVMTTIFFSPHTYINSITTVWDYTPARLYDQVSKQEF